MRWLPWILICAAFPLSVCGAEETTNDDSPTGESVIRAEAGGSEIVITTTARLAGAIHSLTWNGKEFIDSADHGRQLQSAANFDCGGRFHSETFNPTEAGSRRDGAGTTSSSRLLRLAATQTVLQTTSQMAFWLAPGEKSGRHPARNGKVLSSHVLTKRVQIGFDNLPHVIAYDVTFRIPLGERHHYAQFEAVTGYMPPEFNTFWAFNPKTNKLEPLSDGPGEQARPVVLSTPSGSHAMGVYSPQQPSEGYRQAGYGRFRFVRENVVKWNCVFRVRNPQGVQQGKHAFRTFVIVGDRKTVERSLQLLHDRLAVSLD